ncbi:MAG: translocation/assembly module TamB domain-containing protein, partial [Chitinispirillia bacterium]
PNIAFDLMGKDINYSQFHIESFATRCITDSSGVIDSISIQMNNRKSNLQLTGSAALFKPKTFSISKSPIYKILINKSKLYLEDFSDSLGGEVTIFIDAESDLDSASGIINILAHNLDFNMQKFDTIALNGTLGGNKLSINPLTVNFPDKGKITVQGWVSKDKQYKLTLKSTDIPLTSIQKIDELNNIDGFTNLMISGEGSLDTPKVSGSLSIANPSVNKKPLEDLIIQFELEDRLCSITGKSDFKFNGKYNLDKKLYSLNISFDSTRLSPYFDMAGQKDINGFIKGTIKVDGQDTILNNAFCNIENIKLFYKKDNLLSSQNLHVIYKEGQFNAPEFNIKILNRGFFTLKGNYITGDTYSLSFLGDIPFNLVEIFSQDIGETDGNIHIKGNIGGKGKIPDIEVEVALQDIALSLTNLAQKITSINGVIQLSNSAIQLKEKGVRGNIDEGTFICSGIMNLDSLKPSDFSVSLASNAIPISLPDMLDITFDSDIKMKGTMEKASIEGGVTLLDGLYYKDVTGISYNEMLFSLLKGLIGDTNEEIAKTDTAHVNTFMENTRLDIKVSSNSVFIVDNNMALIEIKPDLTVKGNLNSPIITGRASLPYGTITYQKKEFIVNKGIIDFTNPYATEPHIDIESEVEIKEYTIYLLIRGVPPNNIQITLDSDPYLSDDDKLTLLLLGKLRKDILDGEGFSYKSTEELLNNVIGSKVRDNIKNATGFEVDIETDLLSDQEDRIKVTIGKDISKRLNTEYSVETVGGDVIQKATLKYKLFENIQLKGFNDTEGNYGGEIELFFKKR